MCGEGQWSEAAYRDGKEGVSEYGYEPLQYSRPQQVT